MIPFQTSLPDWISEVWTAAISDADLDAETQLVLIPQDRADCGGWQSMLVPPGKAINIEGYEEWDTPQRLPYHRIFVATQRCQEVVAGLIRHELEHVCQYNFEPTHRLATLHAIAWERARDTDEYLRIPTEVHANAAATRFVRSRYPLTIESVIDSCGPLALLTTTEQPSLAVVLQEMCDRYWPSAGSHQACGGDGLPGRRWCSDPANF